MALFSLMNTCRKKRETTSRKSCPRREEESMHGSQIHNNTLAYFIHRGGIRDGGLIIIM